MHRGPLLRGIETQAREEGEVLLEHVGFASIGDRLGLVITQPVEAEAMMSRTKKYPCALTTRHPYRMPATHFFRQTRRRQEMDSPGWISS